MTEICDVTLRDGLQSTGKLLPTARRVESELLAFARTEGLAPLRWVAARRRRRSGPARTHDRGCVGARGSLADLAGNEQGGLSGPVRAQGPPWSQPRRRNPVIATPSSQACA